MTTPSKTPSLSPTRSPTILSLPTSSEEFRTGNDHVGISFASEGLSVQAEAALFAARRWSKIVAGTPVVGATINAGFDPCGFRPFSNDFFLDHLMIIISIHPIDGVGNILGDRGACTFDF